MMIRYLSRCTTRLIRRNLATNAFRPNIDYRYIRDNEAEVQANIKARRSRGCASTVSYLYSEAIIAKKEADDARSARNKFAKNMANPCKNSNSVVDSDMTLSMTPEERAAEGRRLKEISVKLSAKQIEIEKKLIQEALLIPNTTHNDVPIGDSEQIVEKFGDLPEWLTQPRSHLEIAEQHDLLDFASASLVTGSKFVYLKNDAALLEMALIQWAMTKAINSGFTPVICPDVVKPSVVEACGFTPRGDSSQIYKVSGAGDQKLSLAATAEIPLAGMFAGKTFSYNELQLNEKGVESVTSPAKKVVGLSHCFRTEAGAAGEENKGLYRLHQFTKVELFAVSLPEHSDGVLGDIIKLQKEMYSELGLHCRVLNMPSHELGSAAHQKYDIEAWMPSRLCDNNNNNNQSNSKRGAFGEISSASNCTDFQSRRLAIKYFTNPKEACSKQSRKPKKKTAYAHTLNGTACAIPRMILAILETHQQQDGTVAIPAPLQAFMGGRKWIGK